MQLLKPGNNQKSFLPVFAVGTFGLHVVTLMLLTFHGSMLQQLSRRFTPQSLVQLADGRAITVDPTQSLDRHPDTIRRFVGQTMTLILTWSKQQPPETIWQTTSDLLATNAQQKLRSEMMNATSVAQFENRDAETVLIVQRISQPTKIADGNWKVDMVANQIIFSGSDRLGKSVPFNKQILVRATDQQTVTLPNLPLPWHLAAYRLGEARLEIYNICDSKDKNCS